MSPYWSLRDFSVSPLNMGKVGGKAMDFFVKSGENPSLFTFI
jgi:hypothetical protein